MRHENKITQNSNSQSSIYYPKIKNEDSDEQQMNISGNDWADKYDKFDTKKNHKKSKKA